jgi:folate-dependent phosphoribosylglycinamide formyltransferase PurN
MSVIKKTPCIGILGMPDNEETSALLEHLAEREGIPIAFIVYWKPAPRDQLRRFLRKLKKAGLLPALQRICYAFFGSHREHSYLLSIRQYYVPSHNSSECLNILRREKVDILLLATDAIISGKVLQIPRVATLNAHPGWAPRFRGVGSNLYQMEAGENPAISVHQVDEGIDTGPLILREQFPVSARQGLKQIDLEIAEHRRKCLTKAIRMCFENEIQYLDTFLEPSNMTRGMPVRRQRKLDRTLKSGKLVLRSSLGSSYASVISGILPAAPEEASTVFLKHRNVETV